MDKIFKKIVFEIPCKLFEIFKWDYLSAQPILNRVLILYIFISKFEFYQKFVDWLKNLIGELSDPLFTILSFIGIVIAIVIITSGFYIEAEAKKLKDENLELKQNSNKLAEIEALLFKSHEEILKGVLRIINKDIQSNCKSLDKSKCRLSLYLHKNFNLPFRLYARYSDNPERACKGVRVEFKSIGVIQKTWEIGEFYDNEIPEPYSKDNQKELSKEYIEYHDNNYNFEYDELIRTRMKPLTYIGTRVDDSNNIQKGIILLESEEKLSSRQINEINKIFAKHNQLILSTVCNLYPILIDEKIEERRARLSEVRS